MDRRSGDRSERVDLGKFTLVRYSSHGKRFEMVVNPEPAFLFTQGEDVDIDDVVEGGYIIFENFSRGLKATDDDLAEVFGTSEDREVAKLMLKKGELQLTQEQRRAFVQEKRDEILDYLEKHAVNPNTKSPQPRQRIDNAMDAAGVIINKDEDTKAQVDRIIRQLTSTLPLSLESATVEFVVAPKDTGPLYGFLQGAGEPINENWGGDGTLTMIVRVPSGLVAGLLEEVSDQSKGRVRATVIDRSG
ncbi:MAG: ribosome assembly factor SBDS [Candidatus Kariarchaeaceae archaeon]